MLIVLHTFLSVYYAFSIRGFSFSIVLRKLPYIISLDYFFCSIYFLFLFPMSLLRLFLKYAID